MIAFCFGNFERISATLVKQMFECSKFKSIWATQVTLIMSKL